MEIKLENLNNHNNILNYLNSFVKWSIEIFCKNGWITIKKYGYFAKMDEIL